MESQQESPTTSQPATHLRASLIVSTWNGRRLLETCLPRVLQAVAQAGGDHEIIVVDDASSDDTVAYLRREFPQVRLLALERNLRFAGANNAAARIATGDVLIFLNNDMLVEPDFLPPLLEHFGDPAVFAVTAFLQMEPRFRWGGLVRETGLVRARFAQGFFVLRHEDPEAKKAVPVLYAGGGSSAWRRDRFLALGGFDTLFRPFYFEDIDVSYRGQKHGWRLLFEPRSRVEHKHQQTNNPTNFPPGFVELCFEKNHLLFTWKVLTDPDLVAQHFRALRRMLLSSDRSPLLRKAFRQALKQLPELLRKRRRARAGVVLTDREVIARGRAAPVAPPPPAPAPSLPPPPATLASAPRPAARLWSKLFLLRRGTERWGIDVAAPPHRALIVRAGSLALTRQLSAELASRYPAAEIIVVVPEPLAEETRPATDRPVIAAPASEPTQFRTTPALLGELQASGCDTVYVAGEGNPSAERLALHLGGRKVEVRDDGAAHVFSFAPHKLLLILASPLAAAATAAVLTALIGLVWGSLAVEGWLWRLWPRRGEDAPCAPR